MMQKIRQLYLILGLPVIANRCTAKEMILVALFLFPSISIADWSLFGRVTNVSVVEGNDVLRVGVLSMDAHSASFAASCASTIYVDIVLDGTGSSTENARLMHNLVYMGMLTSRDMRFLISEDACSTAQTSSTIPIAYGAQIRN